MNARRILIGLLTLLSTGLFGSTAFAGGVEYNRSTNFTLTKNNIELTFTSGSSADMVSIDSSSVTVITSGSDRLRIRSPRRYELVNDAGLTFTCNREYSELIIFGDRKVVVTPSANKCIPPLVVPPSEPATADMSPVAEPVPPTADTGSAPALDASVGLTNPQARNVSVEEVLSELNRVQEELKSVEKSSVPICGYMRDLVSGSEGSDVRTLQEKLKEAKFFNATPTGYFGPLTDSAVSRWQKSLGITPSNGYFGSISRVKMQGNAAVSESVLCVARDLRLGAKGEDVLVLQKFLKMQGADIYPEGLETAYFGELTLKAVQRFQLKYGIAAKADEHSYGNFGAKTRAKISELLIQQ